MLADRFTFLFLLRVFFELPMFGMDARVIGERSDAVLRTAMARA
jgi:hypothetical protein